MMEVSKRIICHGALAAGLVAAGLLGPVTAAWAAGPGDSAPEVTAVQAELESFTGIGFGRTEAEAYRVAQIRALAAMASAGYTIQECPTVSIIEFGPSASDPRWQVRYTLYCQH